MRMRRVSGSKPKMPSVVTTRETPPKSRPARCARAVAAEPRRAGHEVHAGNEPALLVRGEDEHLAAQRGDVVGAAGAGQPHLRLPVVAADHARVDVAVLVDLGAAHEAVVQEAALGEEERVGDARQHLGPMGRAHLVGRHRQPPGRICGPMMPPSITIVSRGAWRCWASAAASSGTPTPAKTVVSSLSWREPDHRQQLGGVTRRGRHRSRQLAAPALAAGALEPLAAEQVEVVLEGGRRVDVAREVVGHRRGHAARVDVGGVLAATSPAACGPRGRSRASPGSVRRRGRAHDQVRGRVHDGRQLRPSPLPVPRASPAQAEVRAHVPGLEPRRVDGRNRRLAAYEARRAGAPDQRGLDAEERAPFSAPARRRGAAWASVEWWGTLPRPSASRSSRRHSAASATTPR